MTNKEFRLDEKLYPIELGEEGEVVAKKEDIKQAIKLLKEKTKKMWWRRILYPLLDKIMGEGLIK